MTDELRSAQAMVNIALADPDMLTELKTDPAPALKKLSDKAISALPNPRPLPDPSQAVSDNIWSLITKVVALIFFMSAAALCIGLFFPITKEGVSKDTIVTIFTTSIGFLGGLLAPSPVSPKGK